MPFCKLVCLSDCYYEGRFGVKKLHSEGEIYDGVVYEPNSEKYYWAVYKVDSKGINEGHCFHKSKFIDLAEWREQQMLNILNG